MLVPITESEASHSQRPIKLSNSGIKIRYPKAIECGGTDKDTRWISPDSFLHMKWYRFK